MEAYSKWTLYILFMLIPSSEVSCSGYYQWNADIISRTENCSTNFGDKNNGDFLFVQVYFVQKDQGESQLVTREAVSWGAVPSLYLSTQFTPEIILSNETLSTNSNVTYVKTIRSQVVTRLEGVLALLDSTQGCLMGVNTTTNLFWKELETLLLEADSNVTIGWSAPVSLNSSFSVQIDKSIVGMVIEAQRYTFKGSHGDTDVVTGSCDQLAQECDKDSEYECCLVGETSFGMASRLSLVKTKYSFQLLQLDINTNKWLVKGRFPEHITVQSGPGRWQKVDVDNGSNSRVGVERLCLQSLHVIDDSVLILAGSRILFSFDLGQTFFVRTDIVCTNNTETNLVSLQDGGFLLHFLVLDEPQSWLLWYGNVATVSFIPLYLNESDWWTLDPQFILEANLCHIAIETTDHKIHVVQYLRAASNRTDLESDCVMVQDIPINFLIESTLSSWDIDFLGEHEIRDLLELEGITYWSVVLEEGSDGEPNEQEIELHKEDILISCPAEYVHVEAPICDMYTRSSFEVTRVGRGSSISTSLPMPHSNCSMTTPNLPPFIFLLPSKVYNFMLKVKPASTHNFSSLHMEVTGLNPSVQLSMLKSLDEDNETVIFHVALSPGTSQFQYESGILSHEVPLKFKLLGAGLNCLNPLGPIPNIKSLLQMTVYLGCPPNLTVQFNPSKTTSGQPHYCQSTDNFTCVYFERYFLPVFEIVDGTTNEKYPFEGEYTISTVSGGDSLGTISPFNDLTQHRFIQDSASAIWVSLEMNLPAGTFTHEKRGIQWICGPSSPCYGVQPRIPSSPEYFVLLEFSNYGKKSEGCQFKTRFIVKIHGIRMGIGSAVASLLVPMAIFTLIVGLGFLVWKYRERLRVLYHSAHDQLIRYYHRAEDLLASIRHRRVHPLGT